MVTSTLSKRHQGQETVERLRLVDLLQVSDPILVFQLQDVVSVRGHNLLQQLIARVRKNVNIVIVSDRPIEESWVDLEESGLTVRHDEHITMLSVPTNLTVFGQLHYARDIVMRRQPHDTESNPVRVGTIAQLSQLFFVTCDNELAIIAARAFAHTCIVTSVGDSRLLTAAIEAPYGG